MTVLPAACRAFVDLCETHFADELARNRDFKVSGTPMGEDASQDVIYLARYRSRFEFRGLGARSNNRREEITLFVVASSFRARDRQRVAAEAARDRCLALLEGVEDAVVADRFRLGGAVSWGQMSAWDVDLTPDPRAWIATARATLQATHLRA